MASGRNRKKAKPLGLAVRDFALPCPRVGSIETHSGYGSVPQSGLEVHQAAQARRRDEIAGYVTERRVAIAFERGGYEFAVSGRIDGLYREGETLIVEEIKTAFDATRLRRKLEAEAWHPYALQAMTYAYALEAEGAGKAIPRVRVVSSRTHEGDDVEIAYERSSYERWLDLRLEELVFEQKAREANEKRRRRESQNLAFPFERPRPGQQDLITCVERSIAEGRRLMAQAPTGLGKTAGAIYPLLKDSLARGAQLMYVTPKNSQHRLALDAIKRLQGSGAKIRSVSLTAKAKICFKAEPVCDPERCEFARDHYKKMADGKVVAKAAKKRNLGARSIRALAAKHEVCPFELSMEAIERADVVIGDYNYAFAPRNALGRLTDPSWPRARRPNLAIDEAHCLPSRAAEACSPELSRRSLEALRDRFRALPAPYSCEGEAMLDRALAALDGARPSGGGPSRVHPSLEVFAQTDAAIGEFLASYLSTDVRIEAGDPALRLKQEWGEFAAALALAQNDQDGRFAVAYRHDGGGALKIVCSDASGFLRPVYDLFANVVAFSATLRPFDYYAALSGLEGESLTCAEFASPFERRNRKVLVIPQVSTRWSDRAANYGKIADAIARIAAVRPGHYFAFFPSFAFLEAVAHRLSPPLGYEILRQTREGGSTQVKPILERLRESCRPAIVLAVQGGVFAEGVDYPGEMAVGAFVVGPALPTFGIEREIMREHFEATRGSGFDYAYAYPAMAKAVQAAGRVIRSETDRGVIVLMDSRFLEPRFEKAMPRDWFDKSVRELVSSRIIADIEEFWRTEQEEGDVR